VSQIKAVFAKQRLNGVLCLVPMDEDGRALMEKLAGGKPVMVNVHSPRNPRHHRLFFALYAKLVEGGVWEGDEESFLDWAKFGAGHVRRSIDHLGNMHYVPKSISFESMDQVKFARFFDRVCYLVFSRLLDGDGTWEKLRDDVTAMVDQGYSSLGRY